jgi:GNAT superfamily N-acetyltransferase
MSYAALVNRDKLITTRLDCISLSRPLQSCLTSNASAYGPFSSPICTSCELTRCRRCFIFYLMIHPLSYTTSSFGWDPRSKKEEMFHSHARLVLCERCDDTPSGSESILSESRIVAYTIFRFEREAKQDVVYWWVQCRRLQTPSSPIEKSYELQVTEESRGLGVGKFLMGALFDIGSRWRMKNVMLTVFKGKPLIHSLVMSYSHKQ